MLQIALFLLVLCAGVSSAQQVGLSARTDSTSYRIGDWIYLHVDGTVPANVDTIAVAVKDSLGPFEVLGVDRDPKKSSWTIRLMTVDTGTVFIPPVPFQYRVKGDTTTRNAFTNPIALNINSIPVDPKGDIKDIKPPVTAPWTFQDILPYLIVFIVLAGGGVAYYYYRKKRQEKLASYVPPKPKIAPHTAALYALRELEDKKLWQNGKVKEYYSEITDIIRTFFEGRWNFIALELTTDEILRHMKQIQESGSVWDPMQTFFLVADLVKFAKFAPTPEENERELRSAYDIVRAMIPAPVTVGEEQAEEAVHAG